MTQLMLFPFMFEDKPVQPVLLVDHIHLTFEQWMRRRNNSGDIIRVFDIERVDAELRSDYMKQCWQDETKWKEWCDAVQETT